MFDYLCKINFFLACYCHRLGPFSFECLPNDFCMKSASFFQAIAWPSDLLCPSVKVLATSRLNNWLVFQLFEGFLARFMHNTVFSSWHPVVTISYLLRRSNSRRVVLPILTGTLLWMWGVTTKVVIICSSSFLRAREEWGWRQWQRIFEYLPTQRRAEVRRQLLLPLQLNLKPVNQLQKGFYSLSNPLASLTFGSVLKHLGINL